MKNSIRSLAFLLALLAPLGLAGCGQKFELPPRPDSGRIPTPGTFNLDTVWSIPSPTDIIFYGSYIFVVEEHQRLGVYFSRRKDPVPPSLIQPFEGLISPSQICLARSEDIFVFVADMGDTTIKRFSFRGGPPLFTFKDSLWVDITGIAADNQLNVYVAEASRHSIYKYDRDGIRVRLTSDRGTGAGFVDSPHGLSYVKGALWVADTGNHRAERIKPDTTNVAFPGKPVGFDVELSRPFDVATDLSGERVYVVDKAKDRVLRYQATGAFEDSVYTPARTETRVDPPVHLPAYVAADDSLVFLPDSANSRIVIMRLAVQ